MSFVSQDLIDFNDNFIKILISGDLEKIKKILESGDDKIEKSFKIDKEISCKTKNPVYQVVKKGLTEIFKLLLEFGFDPTEKLRIYNHDFGKYDFLTIACEEGQTEIVKILLDIKKFEELENYTVFSSVFGEALGEASLFGYTDIVQLFFDKLAKDSESFKKNESIFFEGLYWGSYSRELMGEDGPDFKYGNQEDVVKLYIRNIEERKLECKKGFFEHIFVRAQGLSLGTMLIIFAKCNPHFACDVKEYCVDFPEDSSEDSSEKFSCNFIMALLCNTLNEIDRHKFSENLVSFVNFNHRDKFNRTPLIFSCQNIYSNIDEYFFRKMLDFSDIHAEDDEGNNALYYLRQRNLLKNGKLQKYIDIFEEYL